MQGPGSRLMVLMLTAFLLLGVVPRAQAQQEYVVDRIMARVNGEIITRSDMVRMLPIYMQIAAQVPPEQLRSAAGRERLVNDFLQYLIDIRLIIARAEQEELSLSMADVDRYLVSYRESLNMSDTEFRSALTQEGVVYDDYRQFMRGHLTRMQLMRTSVLGEITVTDEELTTALAEQFPEGFEQRFLTTSHLLIQVPETATASEVEAATTQALQWRSQVLAGAATFEELATANNPDGTRTRQGRVGTFAVDDLDPEYTRAALALGIGELSEPVRTRFGVHVIRLDGLERRQVEDQERIRERVRYQLMEDRASRQEELYLQRLREEAFVEIRSRDFGL